MASIRILGVTKYGQVVIEQDFVNAADTDNKHPSLAEVEDFLGGLGFQKVPDILHKWYRSADLPLWYGWDGKEDADSGSSLQGNGDLLKTGNDDSGRGNAIQSPADGAGKVGEAGGNRDRGGKSGRVPKVKGSDAGGTEPGNGSVSASVTGSGVGVVRWSAVNEDARKDASAWRPRLDSNQRPQD